VDAAFVAGFEIAAVLLEAPSQPIRLLNTRGELSLLQPQTPLFYRGAQSLEIFNGVRLQVLTELLVNRSLKRIGLVPRQYQSGETDRNGRITKRGSRLLRTMLLECAWVSLQYNDWSRATYDRIHGGQKTHKKKAAITLARKIAVVAWSMLKHKTDWDPARLGFPAAATVEESPPKKTETKAAGIA
jgi:hypothetical protein